MNAEKTRAKLLLIEEEWGRLTNNAGRSNDYIVEAIVMEAVREALRQIDIDWVGIRLCDWAGTPLVQDKEELNDTEYIELLNEYEDIDERIKTARAKDGGLIDGILKQFDMLLKNMNTNDRT